MQPRNIWPLPRIKHSGSIHKYIRVIDYFFSGCLTVITFSFGSCKVCDLDVPRISLGIPRSIIDPVLQFDVLVESVFGREGFEVVTDLV
ncbi:hypothetical protein H2248_010907 [Termitomyces sp. 'cryptogamus']|nr:hypothetical protein H2248_010907 [Termitomyces sp. 'cryptogamus']